MVSDMEFAMKDKIIEQPRELVSEYSFTLRGLSPTIKIRLYKGIDTEGVEFEQSHYIHTPTQAGPYMTSRPWGNCEASALRNAVITFTTYYNSAIREGHTPEDSWLVPNKHF